MDKPTTSSTPRPDSKSLPPAQENSQTTTVDKRGSNSQSTNNKKNDGPSRMVASKGNGFSGAADESAAPGESDGDRDGSENEADQGSSAPPSKKKKGQRFFCTDFPPCNLSFTRSEHLARHIRKHTGERPFQCHCSRRFSRLDNLRQHAQTVHVNEDIPGDSLAATGTRFQRQIRTDRVRPQGRARAGTGGSQGTHSRGHSRNLSTSSIASTTSTFSQPEIRRRPPPLIMANDGSARTRLHLDTMADPPSTPPGQVRGLPGQSAGGSPYTASAIFTANGGSPHFASPMPNVSHTGGFWDGKTPTRRLSVPTGVNPFLQHQPVGTYPAPFVNSTASTPYSNASGMFASPTSTRYPESASIIAADAEMRRRTWHPSTFSTLPRPISSGLNDSYQTPETLQPPFGMVTGSTEPPPRLPGIESFDKVLLQQRPLTPPTRKRTPMEIDTDTRPPPPAPFGAGFTYSQPATRPPPPISGPGHRRGHLSWDMSLHTNLTGLNIRDRTPQRDASHWSQQTINEIQNVASRPSPSYQHASISVHEPTVTQNKLTGWYATSGPQPTRTSPEDSSSSEGAPTPSTASLEYHPAIVHSSGYIEPRQHPIPSDIPQTVCGRSHPHKGHTRTLIIGLYCRFARL